MVRPKKHLGQHFLTDPSVAKRIVDSLQIQEAHNVLEIGPGKGVLTKFLLDKNINLKVVEIDTESVRYLKGEYPDLQIIDGDFLRMDLSEIFDGKEFSVIGNFPYNISSQILFKILENRKCIQSSVGMFQKEVARRICSDKGNKEYGILSVLTQAVYDCSYLFSVNEGVFFPPPKVKSGVLRLNRKPDQLSEESYLKLGKLVKMAFNQRRKQMRNSLSAMLPQNFSHEMLSGRPEQYHFSEFIKLLEQL